MAPKIVLAAVLAGLVLFGWEFVAHDVLPLGEAGFKALPNETATLATLKATIQESGLYMFPAPDDRPDMTSDQKRQAMQDAMAKRAAGPAGMVLILRHGAPMMTPLQLGTQLALDIVSMLLAAIVISSLAASVGFAMRV